MIFSYKAKNQAGAEEAGTIDAPNLDLAISSLQRRNLVVVDVKEEREGGFFSNISFFNRVHPKDIVILSRQIATLFEAKVSVLATFRLLAGEASNPQIRRKLLVITDDIKGGLSISDAMEKHPELFSTFYVSMIKAGEESGKLSETFLYLADYLERTYELVSKTKNALVYPAFVITSFLGVVIIMVVFVIPRLSDLLLETGQDVPVYTKIVLGFSNFFVNYGLILVAILALIGIFLIKYLPTERGKLSLSKFKLGVPYIGRLYQKLYLMRLADNLNTMLGSGISMVRALEITSDVVGNEVYRDLIRRSGEAVKSGDALSIALARHSEIPGIMIQMMKVGEESGRLGFVLETMARFYKREVNDEIETIVGLIEPIMIVVLGIGVGILLTSVLVPIYNIASGL